MAPPIKRQQDDILYLHGVAELKARLRSEAAAVHAPLRDYVRVVLEDLTPEDRIEAWFAHVRRSAKAIEPNNDGARVA